MFAICISGFHGETAEKRRRNDAPPTKFDPKKIHTIKMDTTKSPFAEPMFTDASAPIMVDAVTIALPKNYVGG